MDKKKLETILSNVYGISNPFDRWIKLPQISIIHLEQDANIYVNENCLFYLKSDDMTLNLSQSYKFINIDSTKILESFDAYDVTSRFNLELVTGFISTVTAGPYGTYINRRF